MVDIRELSFAYAKDAPPVLSGVSFRAPDGGCTVILGNNGAGKSTLLKCIVRILRPQEGGVLVDGQDVHALSRTEMARRVAYVAQNAGSSDLTVFDTVLLGRRPYIRWDVTENDRRLVMSLLEQLELEKLMMRPLSQLSGGEVQKVLLARALAQQPRLLLLDEPTSNLDPRNQHEVMNLVRGIARERGICVITVLHDLNLAVRYGDRFLFLKDASVFASGGPECMNPENIEAVYDIHVHTAEYMGVPLIVPFPEVPAEHGTHHSHEGGKHGTA
ncbi:MAG: ABC transporter ATP-binding protein [Oscillospiraceae bacterium]|nr:ABC transporter ATP-binding protein [Oscillospiraceae bacterium]